MNMMSATNNASTSNLGGRRGSGRGRGGSAHSSSQENVRTSQNFNNTVSSEVMRGPHAKLNMKSGKSGKSSREDPNLDSSFNSTGEWNFGVMDWYQIQQYQARKKAEKERREQQVAQEGYRNVNHADSTTHHPSHNRSGLFAGRSSASAAGPMPSGSPRVKTPSASGPGASNKRLSPKPKTPSKAAQQASSLSQSSPPKTSQSSTSQGHPQMLTKGLSLGGYPVSPSRNSANAGTANNATMNDYLASANAANPYALANRQLALKLVQTYYDGGAGVFVSAAGTVYNAEKFKHFLDTVGAVNIDNLY